MIFPNWILLFLVEKEVEVTSGETLLNNSLDEISEINEFSEKNYENFHGDRLVENIVKDGSSENS